MHFGSSFSPPFQAWCLFLLPPLCWTTWKRLKPITVFPFCSHVCAAPRKPMPWPVAGTLLPWCTFWWEWVFVPWEAELWGCKGWIKEVFVQFLVRALWLLSSIPCQLSMHSHPAHSQGATGEDLALWVGQVHAIVCPIREPVWRPGKGIYAAFLELPWDSP